MILNISNHLHVRELFRHRLLIAQKCYYIKLRACPTKILLTTWMSISTQLSCALASLRKVASAGLYLTIRVRVEKLKSRMMRLHGSLILLVKDLLIWGILRSFGRWRICTAIFSLTQKKPDTQDLHQSQNQWYRKFWKGLISNHLRSSTTARNVILILKQKCMMSL